MSVRHGLHSGEARKKYMDMAITTINGFKVYSNLNNSKSIIINSDCVNECMRVYTENHLDGVAITTSHDYRLQNVDFLSEYPEIKHVSISDGINDISAISALPNLESLMLSGKNRKVDFRYFPSLVELIADWSPTFLNMDNCRHLKRLSLYNYSPKSKDCSSISNVPWVKRLEITQSTINTLMGLEKFDQLEELELNYCSKLESLSCLGESKETLASLRCDHCKSIKNHAYVTYLDQLVTLAYNDGGTIPSIKFIKDMTSLKNFMFAGTDVTDGDMTPCIGLTYAGFSNKKHFSHTMEQIKSLSKA
jgi:protein phosphatase 1 regulatory subunit 7